MSDLSQQQSSDRGVLLTSLAISSAFLMEMLDSTIIVSAIPAIAQEFAVDPLRVNLTISLYLMMLAACIPASGWLADRFGARRIFLIAMALFMGTSIFAALAPNFESLVVMRMLQGAAGALMTPIGRLLLIRNTAKEQLAAAIAWMSMPALIGPVLGPLIGGYIVTYIDWRWIFAVKIPFGLVGMYCVVKLIQKDQHTPKYRFDASGFAVCFLVLASLQIVMEQFVHRFLPIWLIAVLLIGAPLFTAWYVKHQARIDKPALDLSLFSLRLFNIGFWAGSLSRIGFNALPFLLQLQLQLGFGWTAAEAGWVVFIVAASALVLKPIMRRILKRFGFRTTLSCTALLGAVSISAIGLVTAETPILILAALVFLFGLFRSLQFNTTNTLLFADIPKERQSQSTALGGVGQQISMAMGISVAAVLVAQIAQLGVSATADTISISIHVVAVITAISGLAFLKLHPHDGASVSHHMAKN